MVVSSSSGCCVAPWHMESLVFFSGPWRRHAVQTALASAASCPVHLQVAHSQKSEHARRSRGKTDETEKGGGRERGRKTTQRCAGGGERRKMRARERKEKREESVSLSVGKFQLHIHKCSVGNLVPRLDLLSNLLSARVRVCVQEAMCCSCCL